jgi:hypothetical protein
MKHLFSLVSTSVFCMLITLLSVETKAQDQLQNWGITSKFIDFDPTFSVSNLLTPGGGSNYTGSKATYAQTSYHDPLGNLMFFIVDGKIYDNRGYYIDNLGTGLNTEIIAVPAKEDGYCGDYYLFYGQSNTSTLVYYAFLDMDAQNPNFSSDPTKKGDVTGTGSIGISYTNGNCRALMLAITPPVANGDRYLYVANCSHLNKIRIQSTATFTHIAGWLMPRDYATHNLRSELEVVKLSNGTYKAAVPYLHDGGGTYNWEIAVFPLSNTGDYTLGTATYWSTLSTSLSQIFKGFEFSSDGAYLYFSQNFSPYLKYINLSTTSVSTLSIASNASDFQNGMIERGTDNKLYFVASNRLASTSNSNNPTGSTWTNSVSGTQFTSFYPITYGGLAGSDTVGKGIRLLLDQVDGQDYTYSFPNTCCEDITQWDETTKSISGNVTWATLATGW